MWKNLIAYFARSHLVTNLLIVAVFVGGIFAWQNTRKEEMPDVTMDWVRISVVYPGASAEDVEYFVTRPIEEEIRGVDGIYRITSASSAGISNITVQLEQDYPRIDEAVTDIRNAVLDVDLPDDIIDTPNVRVFKTAQKAILDIAFFLEDVHLLDVPSRQKLQEYVLAFENQLLSLPEVNRVNRRGYLRKEIHVKARPDQLYAYDIPFNSVMNEVRRNHVRRPVGSLEADQEPRVTLLSELDSVERLKDLIVQGGFEGKVIRLEQVADVKESFEKSSAIYKINGRQGIILNVIKNGSYGILESLRAVNRVVESFQMSILEGTDIRMTLLDDESIDIRNRLNLIAINGTIGFILVLIILFIFLDKSSGLWVALGIPFTFCSTMILASWLGHTINGTTLAAVIIVMGMVVDDAIVVAENIARLLNQGVERSRAVVDGTRYVLFPVIASIVTTMIAFVPLFFFGWRFGKFARFIPPIIFLMLGASLFESIFILPGHMKSGLPWLGKKQKSKNDSALLNNGHWFNRVEDAYGIFLQRILNRKGFIFIGFILLAFSSIMIFRTTMRFVLFPREETREIIINGQVAPGTGRYETARYTRKIEDIAARYLDKEAVGIITGIALSRRGSAVEENRFRIIIEIVPSDKRRKSADMIIDELKRDVAHLEGFQRVDFQKSRWGVSSGSPIELVIQQNDDTIRREVTARLAKIMQNDPVLTNVEVDEGLYVPEYRIQIDRERLKRLSISPLDVSSTFRASLEGTILYEFPDGEENTRVRFTVVDSIKDDINKILEIPVENAGKYLVPLRQIVNVEAVESQSAIQRRDLRRTTLIDAAIASKSNRTPLEIAQHYEDNIFPSILQEFPTTHLLFTGEIEDTRESRDDFRKAIIMVIFLIYFILAVLFNSLIKPLIIMLAIPFGAIGVIFTFWLHGKTLFGFYAAIGVLGLAGVVINDSIVMLVKLDDQYDDAQPYKHSIFQIASIAKTRLRAVVLTTLTTVAAVFPTAYGFAGHDDMLSEMMLALAWGLSFGTLITLILIPCIYSVLKDFEHRFKFHGQIKGANT